MRKGQHKKTRQRHHQRQPGEQLFPIQVITGLSDIKHLFLPIFILYITRIKIDNGIPHLKSPRNRNSRAALGRPAIKLRGGGLGLVCAELLRFLSYGYWGIFIRYFALFRIYFPFLPLCQIFFSTLSKFSKALLKTESSNLEYMNNDLLYR